MPALSFKDIFGQNSNTENIDEVSDNYKVEIDVKDFQNVEDGGEIEGGLGITNLGSQTFDWYSGTKALNLFYAFLLMIRQHQATGKNDDPEQKIYISEGGVLFGTGNRTGQIERRITISMFSDAPVENLTDIDDI